MEKTHEVSSDQGTSDLDFGRSVLEGVLGEIGSTSDGIGLTAEEGCLRCFTTVEIA